MPRKLFGGKKAGVPKRILIRRNDTVKVITGKDKGKTGRVLDVIADRGQVLVEHVGDDQAPYPSQPGQADQGRYRRAGSSDSRFERDAGRLGRQADADRHEDREVGKKSGAPGSDGRRGEVIATSRKVGNSHGSKT